MVDEDLFCSIKWLDDTVISEFWRLLVRFSEVSCASIVKAFACREF